MGITSAEQLVARLRQGKPLGAVLLRGRDAYLRDCYREQVIEAVVEPGARDWAVQRYAGDEDDLVEIIGRAQTMPMLVRRQVIVVKNFEAVEELGEKRREAAVEALMEYLAAPAPFTVLVLEAAALDQRMRLGKMLTEKAMVLPAQLPSDPTERLPMATDFTLRMAGEHKVKLDGDAAKLLADLCNGDLGAVRMELEKLATYAGEGRKVGCEEVRTLVVAEKSHTVWDLAQTIAAGQLGDGLRILGRVLREGERGPGIVGAIASNYRRLFDYGAYGGRQIPRARLVKGLCALYEADSRLKSAGKDERMVLEFMLAKMIGDPARPKAGKAKS
jgi:DNA polymerase-3 subunit delta